jgi:AbrB family looped-hinge helix DNA binding protein
VADWVLVPPAAEFHGGLNGMINAMRSTIDSAGRLVIPKEIRDKAQIRPGLPLEVRLREGRIEIEPAPLEITIRRRGRLAVAVPSKAVPPLTSETVEESRRRLRRERAGD